MSHRSLFPESKHTTVVANRSVFKPAPPVQLVSERQTISSLTPPSLIQPKLKIGAANDKYEQEADRVADQVMRIPDGQGTDSRLQISGLSPGNSIQRLSAGCKQKLEKDNIVQTKDSSGHTPAVTPNVASGIQSLKGGGQPLSESTRSYFEPRFGHDFSQVRIHVDNRAANLANSINARAFTLSRNVVFGDGQYQPHSREGQRLMAHELAHTIQQGTSSPNTSSAARLSNVPSDKIQKDDDEDKERRRRRRSSGSGWRFQFGVGPMRAPSVSGPAASFFPPTQQLPIPGLFLNRGLGFQYSEGQLDFGVFPDLGGSTDFYGTRDIPRLLNPGSSQQQSPTTTLPGIPLPGQQAPPLGPTLPNLTTQTPSIQTPVPATGNTPQFSLRGLRERTIDSFVFNQSSLPSNAAEQLDSMVVWITMARPAIVWVTGHADITGGEQHNQTLSEARAATIRRALIDRGVDESIIESTGEGESEPLITDATTQDQHARNRRVSIEWFDAVPPSSGFRLRPPWLTP